MSNHPSALPTIGERIRQLRYQHSPALTQREVAERAGVSVDLISKLEQGTKQTALLTSVDKIARALDVDRGALLSSPQVIDHGDGPDPGEDCGVVAIRLAITAPWSDANPAVVEDLDQQARYAWSAVVRSKYDVLGRVLPGLIATAQATTNATPGAKAFAAASEVYHAAATMLTNLGHVDLAYVAMERAISAADQADDPLRRTVATGRMSWLLLHHTGGAEHAMRLAIAEADEAEPRLSTARPKEIAAWGGLLVDGAVAAARADRPSEADDLLNMAKTAATRLEATPNGAVDHGFYGRPEFGMPLVIMQQADVSVVTGRPGRALTIATKMAPDVLPVDWRARHLADVAAAQTTMGKDAAATETLLGIEQMSPEWMRYQAYPRTIVRELLERERRARTPRLYALAARLNVA